MNTVLIVGATGVFGARLARHLTQHSDFRLVLAARRAAPLKDLAETLANAPEYRAFDHQKQISETLNDLNPWAVVDCSGPFQAADYTLASACISHGAHFIDLADARDYLAGFSEALNDLAIKKSVCALAGASSTPALSTSVVTALTSKWQRIDTIDIAITPGGKSEVGRAVIAAIMSYAGRDIPAYELGKSREIIGWSRSNRIHIPGLGPRLVSPVETYDVENLSPRVQQRVSFSAGLESWIEQRGLNLIAKLRKIRLFPDPARFLNLFLAARRITRLTTSDTGAMHVALSGLNSTGHLEHAIWTLIAKNDHGPNVPIMAAAAALKKLAAGSIPFGAQLCTLPLASIQAEMLPYAITCETRSQVTTKGLFPSDLPKAVSAFHDPSASTIWSGKSKVTRGGSPIANIIATLAGFPKAGNDLPVSVIVDRSKPGFESWTRRFGQSTFASELAPNGDTITERFGPFRFNLKPLVQDDKLTSPVQNWSIWSIPLPNSLAPRSEASEHPDTQNRFTFDIKLSLPIIGQLVHYQGFLEPERGPERELPS